MRIQILPLPSVVVGDDVQEPFALIVDQWPEGAYDSSLQGFADMCGAKAVWVRSETVEVVDRYAETPPQKPAPEGDTATDGLLPPNTIVLADRNGNPMNMWVTCSCGRPMGRHWTAVGPLPDQERTELACNGCGNRLTVTIPLGERG